MYKLLASAIAAVALVGCAQMREMMHEKEFESNLVACPAKNMSIGDVPSCGKVWKLTWGYAELKGNGDIEAEVKGLVLDDLSTGTANGTADGVDGVAATVICHAPEGMVIAAQTDVVPLSKTGDAKV